MKKIIAVFLGVLTVLSFSTVAFAADTTTLTTTVPDATYTLNIPENQLVPFGKTRMLIGTISVTDASGFAVGKNLELTISYDAFISTGISTTIPYQLSLSSVSNLVYSTAGDIYFSSGDKVSFAGKSDGTVTTNPQNAHASNSPYLFYESSSTDWGKALAGEYSSTITFTAEVVSN